MTQGNGDGKKAQDAHQRLHEAVYEAVQEAAVERNLDMVGTLATDLFITERQAEWNRFIENTVIPALKARGEAEVAAVLERTRTAKGKDITDEWRRLNTEGIRKQFEALLAHAPDHLLVKDGDSNDAAKAWRAFAEGTGAVEVEV